MRQDDVLPDLQTAYDEDSRRLQRFGAPLVVLILASDALAHLFLFPEAPGDAGFVPVALLGSLPIAALAWLSRIPRPAGVPPERYWGLLPFLISLLALLFHMQNPDARGSAQFMIGMMFGAAVLLVAPIPFYLCIAVAGPLLIWWTVTELPPTDLMFSLASVVIAVGLHLVRHNGVVSAWEQRRLERQLEQQRDADERRERLRALSGGMAHHFSNILTGVIGGASLALDQLEAGHRARGAVEAALRAGQSGAALLERLGVDVFANARSQGPFAAAELVDESDCQAIVRPPARVECRIEDGLPEINGDRERLRVAILELVDNAAEALPEEGGVVRVEIASDGERVLVDIIDSGAGLDATERARIFEPFHSTRGSTRRGLGLTFVLGVVSSHGGSIDVDSQPSVGTRFRVALPTAARRARETGAGRPSSGRDGS